MDNDRKKELKNAYRSRPIIGGVCCFRCSGNGRYWIQSTRDIEALRNRFNFSLSMKTAPEPSMREECEKYGADSFSFSVLEELKKREDQTDKEFSDDLKLLYEIWLEKANQGEI